MIDKMLGNPWLCALGFSGQLVFMTRFIVQWIASERRKRSVIPITFWYLSIGGAALLLVYAVMDRDPVFIVSQSLGIVVYFRNLVLLWREGTKECEAERAA